MYTTEVYPGSVSGKYRYRVWIDGKPVSLAEEPSCYSESCGVLETKELPAFAEANKEALILQYSLRECAGCGADESVTGGGERSKGFKTGSRSMYVKNVAIYEDTEHAGVGIEHGSVAEENKTVKIAFLEPKPPLRLLNHISPDRQRRRCGRRGRVAHVQCPRGRREHEVVDSCPSRPSACARTPANVGSTSSGRSSGTYRAAARTNAGRNAAWRSSVSPGATRKGHPPRPRPEERLEQILARTRPSA